MESTSAGTARNAIDAARRTVAFYLEHRITALRLALGIIYVYFGMLKFFGGASPAAELATDTMSAMTFHAVPAGVSRPLLALMETLIGLGFLSGRLRRLTGVVFLAQVLGAMSSVVLAHGLVWSHTLFVPTMDGQYVIKDIVLLTAGIVVLTAPQRLPVEEPSVAVAEIHSFPKELARPTLPVTVREME